jgi:G3E family GTPase
MENTEAQRISFIDLVTGFLGAGKTAFIAHYIEWLKRQGQSFAVLENEFGAVGVDSATLKETGGDIEEISGGCLCCGLLSGFSDTLTWLSGRYDRIIVEPSGIFDAATFSTVMKKITKTAPARTGFSAMICDPRSLDVLRDTELAVLKGELTGISTVIFSKCDLPELPDLNECGEFLKKLSGRENLALEKKGSMEFSDEDFARLQGRSHDVTQDERSKVNHSELFHCPSLPALKALNREEAEQLLEKALTDKSLGDILRVKGTVPAVGGSYFALDGTVADHFVKPVENGAGVLYFIMKGNPKASFRSVLSQYLK